MRYGLPNTKMPAHTPHDVRDGGQMKTGTTFKMGQMEMFFDGGDAPTFRVGVFLTKDDVPLVGVNVRFVDAITFDTMTIAETDRSGFAGFTEPPTDARRMFVATVDGVTRSAQMDRLSPAKIDFGEPGIGTIVGAAAALSFGYLALSLLS